VAAPVTVASPERQCPGTVGACHGAPGQDWPSAEVASALDFHAIASGLGPIARRRHPASAGNHLTPERDHFTGMETALVARLGDTGRFGLLGGRLQVMLDEMAAKEREGIGGRICVAQ